MAKTKKTVKTVSELKGETTMENKTEEKKFNYFEFFKYQVLKEYFTKKFKGEDTTELTIHIKYSNSKLNYWFYQNNALKFGAQTTTYDEDGSQMTAIVIKELNLDAKATSKAGKEFKVFNSYDIAKATKSALKQVA